MWAGKHSPRFADGLGGFSPSAGMQVGLNAVGLADQEEGLLPEGADEAAYARASHRALAPHQTVATTAA